MIRPELILDLNHELIVDNFAGGGGASSGIEAALGRHVDHAINHDADALGMHRINHPQTVHHCEDVFDIDPLKITEGRKVGLGWFSPDCKHHSKAKGGKPLDKKIRGLAFVMFRWARIRTRVMMMENVEEIQTWGPLYEDHSHGCRGGKECTPKCHFGRPIPEHKCRTWKAFLDVLGGGIDPNHPDIPEMMSVLNCHKTIQPFTKAELVRGFGYHIEVKEIRAADHGAPTIRKRLFMIARCDGRPIVWPSGTYADRKLSELADMVVPQHKDRNRVKPWRPIAECIDWHLPCPSIFLTPAQALRYRCRRPLKKNTLRRVAAGVDRYVLKAKKPFIVSLTHQGGERIEPIDQPAKTLTGAHRGEKALVDTKAAHIQREFGQSIGQPVTGPAPTVMPHAQGKSALVETSLAPFVTEHANATHQRNFSAEDALRTQMAEVKGGHFALVAGSMVHTAHGEQDKNGKKRGRGQIPVTEPLPSVLASPDMAVVAASLVEYHSPKRPGDERVKPVDKPLPVQSTEPRFALVAAHLTKFNTGSTGSDANDPAPTIVAGTHSPETHGGAASTLGLVAASMVKLCGDPATHPSEPATDPIHTVRAGGLHHGINACYLAQHNAGNNTNPGHPANEPGSTISGKGCQQQVVAASLAAYYGSEADGQAIEESLRSITTKGRFGLAEARAVAPGLTDEQIIGALRVAAFLREYGVKFDGEFAMVGDYIIVDIGMRMLTPRELFRAQGFHEGYVIDRAWLVHPKTGEIQEKVLTKEAQIRMCGNSVSPPCAAALAAANVPELAIWRNGERKEFERQHKILTQQRVGVFAA